MVSGGSKTIDSFVSADGSVEELIEFNEPSFSKRLEVYNVTSFYVGKILNYFRTILGV